MVVNVDTVRLRAHHRQVKISPSSYNEIFSSACTDFAIGLPTWDNACCTIVSRSNQPPELATSRIIPADKLARERLGPADCEASYHMSWVLRLHK